MLISNELSNDANANAADAYADADANANAYANAAATIFNATISIDDSNDTAANSKSDCSLG